MAVCFEVKLDLKTGFFLFFASVFLDEGSLFWIDFGFENWIFLDVFLSNLISSFLLAK